MSPTQPLGMLVWIVGILLVTAIVAALGIALTTPTPGNRGRLALFFAAVIRILALMLFPLTLLFHALVTGSPEGGAGGLTVRGKIWLLVSLACIVLALALPNMLIHQVFAPLCIDQAHQRGDAFVEIKRGGRRVASLACFFASGQSVPLRDLTDLDVPGIAARASLPGLPLLVIPLVPPLMRRLRQSQAAHQRDAGDAPRQR